MRGDQWHLVFTSRRATRRPVGAGCLWQASAPGATFRDYQRSDHTAKRRKLSQVQQTGCQSDQ